MIRVKNDDPVAQLDALLREYTDEIRALVYAVLTKVDARLAGATRMVYANWNATVVGYCADGKAPAFCLLGCRIPQMGEPLLLRRPRTPRPARPAEGQRLDGPNRAHHQAIRL